MLYNAQQHSNPILSMEQHVTWPEKLPFIIPLTIHPYHGIQSMTHTFRTRPRQCMFGILKGRWHIQETGIRLHGVAVVNKIWKTCCASHNWLLQIDGLDENWNNGVASDWQGELGEHAEADVHHHLLFAIQRLHSPAKIRGFDASIWEWLRQ